VEAYIAAGQKGCYHSVTLFEPFDLTANLLHDAVTFMARDVTGLHAELGVASIPMQFTSTQGCRSGFDEDIGRIDNLRNGSFF